jgi:hypothetical protein
VQRKDCSRPRGVLGWSVDSRSPVLQSSRKGASCWRLGADRMGEGYRRVLPQYFRGPQRPCWEINILASVAETFSSDRRWVDFRRTQNAKDLTGFDHGVAILAATSLANAQSATPIEGNPSAARPAPPVSGTVVMPASPSTTGAAPNSAAFEIGRGCPYAWGQSRQGSRFDPNPRAAGQIVGSRITNGPAMSGPFHLKHAALDYGSADHRRPLRY